MSRDRFMFIWRFFHVGLINEYVDNEAATNENDEGDELVDLELDCV